MQTKEALTKDKQRKLQGIQKDKKIAKSGEIRKDAHVSSRNKRDQAKRDKRSETSN